jgi:hypothetical protein
VPVPTRVLGEPVMDRLGLAARRIAHDDVDVEVGGYIPSTSSRNVRNSRARWRGMGLGPMVGCVGRARCFLAIEVGRRGERPCSPVDGAIAVRDDGHNPAVVVLVGDEQITHPPARLSTSLCRAFACAVGQKSSPPPTLVLVARFLRNAVDAYAFRSIGTIRQTVMWIYLFRAGSSRTFAYSVDVTGRNIPSLAERANWQFERKVEAKQLKDEPEALLRVRRDGFYVFNAPTRASGNG